MEKPAGSAPENATSGPTGRPSVTMAVVMRRKALASRWQSWKWELDAVLPDLGEFGTEPLPLEQDAHGALWLFPGFEVALFRDQAEGYYLNLSATAPCWFVLWRPDETCEDAPPRPLIVSLSYYEAGRWLDAGETVENVPLAPEQHAWLKAYVAEHYRPEPKQRRRPESFKAPKDRARF